MKNSAVGRTGGETNDRYFVCLEKPLIDAFLQLGQCLFRVYYGAEILHV